MDPEEEKEKTEGSESEDAAAAVKELVTALEKKNEDDTDESSPDTDEPVSFQSQSKVLKPATQEQKGNNPVAKGGLIIPTVAPEQQGGELLTSSPSASGGASSTSKVRSDGASSTSSSASKEDSDEESDGASSTSSPMPQAQPEGVASTSSPASKVRSDGASSTSSSASKEDSDEESDGASSTSKARSDGAPPVPPVPPPAPQAPPPPAQPGSPQWKNQMVDMIFNLNQPQPAQQGAPQGNGQPQQAQGGGQQPPQGVHAPSYLPAPQPKQSSIWDKLDFASKASGYATDIAGGISGLEKILLDDELSLRLQSDEANANDDADPKENHKLGMGILNTAAGVVKCGSSAYNMSRQIYRAHKLKGRNRIEHNKNTVNAVASGFKSVGGLSAAIGSGVGLGDYTDTATGLGILGSFLGSTGSVIDMAASGYASEKYRKLANDYSSEGIQKRQKGPNRITDKSVLDAAGMASLTARNKHHLNAASSVFSTVNLIGGGLGLFGGISTALGSRLTSGWLGLAGNLTNMIGRIGSRVAEDKIKSSSQSSRRQYVNDYLDKESKKIKKEVKHRINIDISPEDGKRIALKKLGMFSGDTVTGAALNIDEKQLDMIYNSLAMNRAQSIHSSANNANGGSAQSKQMLTDLGLNSNNATVEEIAAALGYQA